MLTAFMLAATVAPAPPLTLQQQFDAATTALAAGKWAEAEAQFAALERRDDGRPSVSLAVSHVRRGIALSHLDRLPEAETELETGLATLPKARPELVQDRGDGTLALASIAEEWLDYPDAARMYQVARDLAPDSQTKLDSLAGLARVTMFTDSAGAVAIADAALKLALAQPALNPTIPGLRTLRGRALLNDHRFAEAQTELRLAVKQLGGLTATVDRADITARSDFAIAALLAGQSAVARIALAYTGAGLADADLDFAADAVPPPCGGADGLVPDDVAVVEFSIRDDGSVGNPRPIYASRQGPVAVAFARAVAS